MRDFTITDPSILAPVKKARTIFVYTHQVKAFFREIVPHLAAPVTLITHNSDDLIDERFLTFIENEKISHWYGQNVAISHEKITALPIGLANSQWPHGQLDIIDNIIQQTRDKTGMLYMNFDPRTNPDERLPIYSLFKDNPLTTTSNGLNQEAYLKELASHFFCISPPGNGLDCHRIWECLYLGVIPIVLRNPGMEHFFDLPISFVDNWEQVDKNFLQTEFQRTQQQRNIAANEKLDINYWAKKIADSSTPQQKTA